MKIKIDTRFDSMEDLIAIGDMLLAMALVKSRTAPSMAVLIDPAAEEGTIPSFAYVPFHDDVELGTGNDGVPLPKSSPLFVLPPKPAEPEPFILRERTPEPALTPLPPGAPAPTVELDATGTPWDGRIHSVGRSKVANGMWRLRRGVDDAAVKAVESQHQFAATVPPVPAAAVMSFGALMQRITALAVSGEMTPGEVAKTLRDAGLPAIPALASRPDLIGDAAHALGFLP